MIFSLVNKLKNQKEAPPQNVLQKSIPVERVVINETFYSIGDFLIGTHVFGGMGAWLVSDRENASFGIKGIVLATDKADATQKISKNMSHARARVYIPALLALISYFHFSEENNS